MNLEDLRRTWDAFACLNPMWAVLTAGKKPDYQWDEDAFYQNGSNSINFIIQQCLHCWLDFPRTRALDFGCGIGRLSLRLADWFEQVDGVDISSEMIAHAMKSAKHRGITNCCFHENPSPDLRCFCDSSFDFIVSMITLQHMEPQFSKAYLREFVRLLKPDGVLCFQLPEEIQTQATYRCFDDAAEGPEMEMYGIPRSEVCDFMESMGAEVNAIIRDNACGPDVRSFRYFVKRKIAK